MRNPWQQLLRLLPNQEANITSRIHWGDLWVTLGAYPQAQKEYGIIWNSGGEADYEQAQLAFRTLPLPYWQSWLYSSLATDSGDSHSPEPCPLTRWLWPVTVTLSVRT